MLIIYDAATGDIVDNTGTNTAMPEGPPIDLAYVNTDARGLDRAALGLLRLHDVDDAATIEAMRGHAYTVDPAAHAVVVGDPLPEPEPEPDYEAEFRTAVEAATSITDLKAALLGTRGPGAEPRRGRPT